MLAGFGIDPIGERVAEDRPDDVLGHEQFRGETICLSFPGFVIRVFFLILGIVLEGKNPSLGEFGANLIRMKQEMPQFVGKGEALSWDRVVGVDKKESAWPPGKDHKRGKRAVHRVTRLDRFPPAIDKPKPGNGFSGGKSGQGDLNERDALEVMVERDGAESPQEGVQGLFRETLGMRNSRFGEKVLECPLNHPPLKG
jgi:hypothetical protein